MPFCTGEDSSPSEASLETSLLLYVLANIHYCFWALPKINEDHKLLQQVTRTPIFDFAGNRCNRPCHKNHAMLKSKIVKKRHGIQSKMFNICLRIHVQKSSLHHRLVTQLPRSDIDKYKKNDMDFLCFHLIDLQNTCLQ